MFAVVSGIVALRYHGNVVILSTGLILAVAFAAMSFLTPSLLRPLNIAWLRVAQLLHKVVSPLVMGGLFLLVILPFGLVMRIRYDPLRKKRGRDRKSYWIDRKSARPAPAPLDSMQNQF